MHSIQSKILILIISSIILVTSIVGIVLVQRTYDTFYNETIEKLDQMTNRYASEFNNELRRVEEMAIGVELLVESLFDYDALEKNPNYLDDFEIQLAPVIKNIAEQGIKTKSAYVFFMPSLDNEAHDVWYSDLNYNGIVDRQEEFEIDYYSEFIPGREWFFMPLESRDVYWTNPYAGNADYDAHIIYVSHTRPAIVDGEIIGIVGSDYHFNLMKEDIENINVFDNGYAFLLNEYGDVLIHPTLEQMENLINYSDGDYSWINDRFLNEKTGVVEYEWVNKKEKIMVFAHLNNDWIFGITFDTKDAFKWITQLQWLIVIIILVSIFIVCFIGYQVGAYITKHLVALTEHVKVIGDGDYNFEIPNYLLNRKDETGRLAVSIETMRQLQKISFDQILNHNEILESEIEKRTKSLVESHEELESSLNDNVMKTKELEQMNLKLESAIEDIEIAQRQLIESEKIASLSFLVTRMAHEFNTPVGSLTTLLTYVFDEKLKISKGLSDGVLKKDDLENFLSKFDESNALMLDNLKRIKLLVSRFKELDPHSHFTLNSKINVSNFMEVVIDSLDVDNDDVGIEVLCDDQLEIEIDAGKLSQIIMHLLENALQHGFGGFMSGLIIVDIRYEESKLLIRIHDNGVGIPKDVMDHIYVPFYTGSIGSESSGLGLNIVYNIVTKVFGGEITCNSHPDDGTEFIIVINL